MSKVLNGISNISCEHEGTESFYRCSWRDTIVKHDQQGPKFWDPYLEYLYKSNNKKTGISSAYADKMLLDRWDVLDVRCLQLVRNGIENVRSLYNTHTMRTPGLRKLVATHIIGLDKCPSNSFKFVCKWWANEMYKHIMIKSLADSHLKLRLCPLGILTSSKDRLIETVEFLIRRKWKVYPKTVKYLQKNRINDHIIEPKDRKAKTIWASWSKSQKRLFCKICGPTMEYFGFDMP